MSTIACSQLQTQHTCTLYASTINSCLLILAPSLKSSSYCVFLSQLSQVCSLFVISTTSLLQSLRITTTLLGIFHVFSCLIVSLFVQQVQVGVIFLPMIVISRLYRVRTAFKTLVQLCAKACLVVIAATAAYNSLQVILAQFTGFQTRLCISQTASSMFVSPAF